MHNCMTLAHDAGRYEQAVRYYTTASAVLKAHSHVESLHRILVEADAIMHSLKETLAASICEPDIESYTLTEYIKLLMQLDGDADSLSAAFLEWHTMKIGVSLAKAVLTKDGPHVFMQTILRLVLDPLASACDEFTLIFPDRVAMLPGFVKSAFAGVRWVLIVWS